MKELIIYEQGKKLTFCDGLRPCVDTGGGKSLEARVSDITQLNYGVVSVMLDNGTEIIYSGMPYRLFTKKSS